MKAQFIVTIEGDWKYNGKKADARMAERELREAVKEQFEFLAKKATVKRAPAQQQDGGRDAALTDEQITESAHDAGMRLHRFEPTSVRTLRRFLAAIAAQQGKKG